MHHSPKAAKQCRLSEDYGHRDTLAANWGDPNGPAADIEVVRNEPSGVRRSCKQVRAYNGPRIGRQTAALTDAPAHKA